MSRASEAELKACPIQGEWVGNQYGEWDDDKNQELRKAFQRGYEQAEKEIEKRIMKYLDSRNDSNYATIWWIKKHFDEYKKVIMEDSHE